MKYLSTYQYLQILVLKLIKYDNFQPFQVVVRGSETQPQLIENLNNLNKG